MIRTSNNAIPEPGHFRRAVAAVWAFLRAMESTGFENTLDRVDHLEREVGRLKEELRRSKHPEAGDVHDASLLPTSHESPHPETPRRRC